MNNGFLHTTLGRNGPQVCRLGLSASYRPGKETIHAALDEGVDYFFAYGFDTQMVHVLRSLSPGMRDRIVIATGAYNYKLGHADVRRTCEKRLRQLRTDRLDVFLFLGVLNEREFTRRAHEDLIRLREEGKVRAIGISTHDRKLAGRLAAEGALDVLMIRYSAAHRGAELDIFPQLSGHDPGIIGYTATSWTRLLRRPRGWPAERELPDASMCYRFLLSNPAIDVSMTAPSNLRQFRDTLRGIRHGPLEEAEMQFMREFGDAVYRRIRWFL